MIFRFSSLPKPKETDWELELPEEQKETNGNVDVSEEDATERDRRDRILREAADKADFKRRTQVLQRNLPRPVDIDTENLLENAANITDPVESAVATEMALLVIHDALKYPDANVPAKVTGVSRPLESFDDEELNKARLEIALEMPSSGGEDRQQRFEESWLELHSASLPGLAGYGNIDSEPEKQRIVEQTIKVSFFFFIYTFLPFPLRPQNLTRLFFTQHLHSTLLASASTGNALEKKLALHLGGYQSRAKTLRAKIVEAAAALEAESIKLDSCRTLQIAEEAALPRRLERLEEEVRFVKGREREAQEAFRLRRDELD